LDTTCLKANIHFLVDWVLIMEMTHTRRKKNSNKERKRVLREMKRVVTVVRAHAQR